LEVRWEEIDLETNMWTVPAKRMKMKQAHTVPLSARCVEILNLAKELNGGEIIFPSKPETTLSNMAFLMCLRRWDMTI